MRVKKTVLKRVAVNGGDMEWVISSVVAIVILLALQKNKAVGSGTVRFDKPVGDGFTEPTVGENFFFEELVDGALFQMEEDDELF